VDGDWFGAKDEASGILFRSVKMLITSIVVAMPYLTIEESSCREVSRLLLLGD